MAGWTVLDEQQGLWTFEIFDAKGFGLRTTALRLRDGGVLLVSPARALDDAAHAELASLGRPSVLLAPNHFHHLGLRAQLDRYPDARVVGSATALPRLEKQTGLDIGEWSEVSERLPGGAEIVDAAGTKSGEAWLVVQTARGTAWVVSDAFFNVPSVPGGVFGLALRLTDTGPGLRIGRTFTTLAVKSKRTYRKWLFDLLDRAPPALLVPGHGDLLEGPDLAEKLRALAVKRLGAA